MDTEAGRVWWFTFNPDSNPELKKAGDDYLAQLPPPYCSHHHRAWREGIAMYLREKDESTDQSGFEYERRWKDRLSEYLKRYQ